MKSANATSPAAGAAQTHRITVLVGFAEASSAPEVVWSLVDEGFNVIAFARKGRPSALRHSRHVVCHDITPPESNLQKALSDLQSLLRTVEVPASGAQRLLFPLDDTAVWLCSRLNPEPGWLMAGPQGDNAALALDKHLQTQAALAAGFNVPTSALARTAAEVFAFGAGSSFPVILKSAECVPSHEGRRYGCRKWVCANRSELEQAVKEWGGHVPLLAQSFVSGNGEGVFGLATATGVRAWSAHRRLRMMNPQGSGSSACISQPVPPDIAAKVEALLKSTGWRGLFMVELLRDAAGQLWFVELNGRPWGSMALSRRQGLEYPAWHLRLVMDDQSSAGLISSSAPGLVCRNAGRELMHLLFVLRGPRSKALIGWPSFWKAIREMFHVRGGDGLYNWRSRDPKVFFADCYYTLHEQFFKPHY